MRAPLVPLATALSLLGTAPGSLAGQRPDASRDELPPVGYGTLRQDDVAIAANLGSVSLQVIPLDEWVIRLLAPDTYRALRSLRLTVADTVDVIARLYGLGEPTLFFVTFFGRQERARFEPEILTITSQNRFFRPVEILPRSPHWNRRQLEQRETASAVYVYEGGIPLQEPLVLSYGEFSTDRWGQVLRVLDRERSRVLARAAADREPY